MSNLIPVDAVQSAANHLAREWGDVGYSIGAGEWTSWGNGGVYTFECGHSDGSRWFIAADRWGNCASGDTATEARHRYEADRSVETRRREAADAADYADACERVYGGGY